MRLARPEASAQSTVGPYFRTPSASIALFHVEEEQLESGKSKQHCNGSLSIDGHFSLQKSFIITTRGLS